AHTPRRCGPLAREHGDGPHPPAVLMVKERTMPTSVKANGSKRTSSTTKKATAAVPAEEPIVAASPEAPAKARSGKSPKGFSFPPEAEITRDILDSIEPREIWIHFQKTRSLAIRNYFLERFMHLVRYNAERIHTRLPDEVDV